MNNILKQAFLITILLTTSAHSAACADACKKQQVEDYLEHIVKIFIDGSSTQQIDNFLARLHDDVKYEHEEYGADFNKERWRAAFIRQLKLGSYKDGSNTKGRIINIIYGKNHAAVEYSYGTLNDDGWRKGHVKFALFGFKDGKVSLVREYW